MRMQQTYGGKEIDKKSYADPIHMPKGLSKVEQYRIMSKQVSSNWFDKLGWRIANPFDILMIGKWEYVKNDLFLNLIRSFKLYEKKPENYREMIEYILEELKPFFDLIDLWDSKKYVPKSIIK